MSINGVIVEVGNDARVRLIVQLAGGEGEIATDLHPIAAGLLALELQRIAALVGPRSAMLAERDRRLREGGRSATTEPAPIGLPPLPPSGPSVRLGSEAHPDEVEAEKNPNTTPTKRGRKR